MPVSAPPATAKGNPDSRFPASDRRVSAAGETGNLVLEFLSVAATVLIAAIMLLPALAQLSRMAAIGLILAVAAAVSLTALARKAYLRHRPA